MSAYMAFTATGRAKLEELAPKLRSIRTENGRIHPFDEVWVDDLAWAGQQCDLGHLIWIGGDRPEYPVKPTPREEWEATLPESGTVTLEAIDVVTFSDPPQVIDRGQKFEVDVAEARRLDPEKVRIAQ
jgi:hypothetical protein